MGILTTLIRAIRNSEGLLHVATDHKYYLLCTYQYIAPLPPLRSKWGFTGGIDTKLLPHYGAFHKGIDRQSF